MSHLHNLEQIEEEVPEGTFVFKVKDFFAESGVFVSPPFKFGRSSISNLMIGPQVLVGASFQPCHLIYLALHVPSFLSVFSKVAYYRMSIIDPSGREIQSIKGTIFPKDNPIICMCFSLLVIYRRLLPDNTLTVRLSWYSRNKSNLEGTLTTKGLTTEKPQQTSLKKLLNDIMFFYDSNVKTDCVLCVGNVKIPAHRAVLSARSIVFSAEFQHKRSKIPVVHIRSEVIVLANVVKYMYSGKIHGLNTKTAASMYIFAYKYAMDELRDHCLCFLKKNITVENACDIAVLAHTYGETKLEEIVLKFIENKLEDIYQSNAWKRFVYYKPSVGVKYLKSFIASKKNKKLQIGNKKHC